MEIVGLDTGFFIRVLERNERAVDVWNRVLRGEIRATTSSLVLFELKRLFHKFGKIAEWEDVKEAITLNCEVVPIDVHIAEEGASISYGTGLPAVDTLIYTSVKSADKFYTTDGSFKVLKQKRPRIILLD